MTRYQIITEIMCQVREALPDAPEFWAEVEFRLNCTHILVLRQIYSTNAVQRAEADMEFFRKLGVKI